MSNKTAYSENGGIANSLRETPTNCKAVYHVSPEFAMPIGGEDRKEVLNCKNKHFDKIKAIFKFNSTTYKLEEPNAQENSNGDTNIKLYKRRFWILLLFATCSMLNAMEFIQYSVIANVIECYYGVGFYDVNWTTMVYYLTYIPFVWPVSWFLHRFGMKITLLTGSFLTCISTVIQCLSQNTNGFPIAMVSQTIAGIAQVFILPLPPKLSSAWFGPTEVCRATSVGVFGNQLGVALGFIFTPMVVSNDCSRKDLIKHGRSIVAYVLTACNVAVFLLILTTFQLKPPKPPSPSEASRKHTDIDHKKTMIALFRDCNFILVLISYGVIAGVLFAFASFLNAMVSPTYPHAEKEIGVLGAVIIVAGLLGSVVAGYVLDKTHRFKETSIAIFVLSLLSMITFAACLYVEAMWLLFLTGFFLGFFLASYIPVGFEFVTEITYPAPEGTTAGLLNTSLMVFGAALTAVGQVLITNFSRLVLNIFFCCCVLFGCILIVCIKPELRRTETNRLEQQENKGGQKTFDPIEILSSL